MRLHSGQNGQALIYTLGILALVLFLIGAMGAIIVNQTSLTAVANGHNQAYDLALAGMNRALADLDGSVSDGISLGQGQLSENNLNGGSYLVTWPNGQSQPYTLQSVGTAPKGGSVTITRIYQPPLNQLLKYSVFFLHGGISADQVTVQNANGYTGYSNFYVGGEQGGPNGSLFGVNSETSPFPSQSGGPPYSDIDATILPGPNGFVDNPIYYNMWQWPTPAPLTPAQAGGVPGSYPRSDVNYLTNITTVDGIIPQSDQVIEIPATVSSIWMKYKTIGGHEHLIVYWSPQYGPNVHVDAYYKTAIISPSGNGLWFSDIPSNSSGTPYLIATNGPIGVNTSTTINAFLISLQMINLPKTVTINGGLVTKSEEDVWADNITINYVPWGQ